MHLMFLVVVTTGALLFVVGYRLGKATTSKGLLAGAISVATLCAVPGIIMSLYYLHWFDDAVWFYEFRSLPLVELSALGAGLSAGLIHAVLVRRKSSWRPLMPGLLFVGLAVPYIKPLIAPLEFQELTAQCPNGICLQSTPSTCGPASIASILRSFGYEENEETLAREAYTTATGTENWHLARALRRRGFAVSYVVRNRPVDNLPVPSMAGVVLNGGVGHFISVLEESESAYMVGDPMVGSVIVPKSAPGDSYNFTGFFMVVDRPDS